MHSFNQLLNEASCAAIGAQFSPQSNLFIFLDGRSQRQTVRQPSDYRQEDHADRRGRSAAARSAKTPKKLLSAGYCDGALGTLRAEMVRCTFELGPTDNTR